MPRISLNHSQKQFLFLDKKSPRIEFEFFLNGKQMLAIIGVKQADQKLSSYDMVWFRSYMSQVKETDW